MLLIALAVKLESKGPVIFRQQRLWVQTISRSGCSNFELCTMTSQQNATLPKRPETIRG